MTSIKSALCGLLLAFQTSACFATESDGTWRDPQTGLLWMRCFAGQVWSGSTCSGALMTMTWSNAMKYPEAFNAKGFAGKNDWRLPTIEELVTIRRCSEGWRKAAKATHPGQPAALLKVTLPNGRQVPEVCADGSQKPALDTAVFPGMEKNTVSWSSSSHGKADQNAWLVLHDYGGATTFLKEGATLGLLLVRSGK